MVGFGSAVQLKSCAQYITCECHLSERLRQGGAFKDIKKPACVCQRKTNVVWCQGCNVMDMM